LSCYAIAGMWQRPARHNAGLMLAKSTPTRRGGSRRTLQRLLELLQRGRRAPPSGAPWPDHRAAERSPAATQGVIAVVSQETASPADRRAAKNVREIEKAERKLRDAERVQQVERDAARQAERAGAESANRELALQAERKAARDARYAARKSQSER
jgi:hypothetical protein